MNSSRIRYRIEMFLRQRAWVLLACSMLAPLGIGRAAPTEVPDAPSVDVMTADRDFARFALDAGVRAAYERYLDADAVVFRPLPVPARQWLSTHEPATGRLESAPVLALSACDSSLAVTFGTWRYTARDSDSADTGQYLTAWRRNDDGAWRIVLDQSLSVPALPAASPTPVAGCDEAKPVADALRVAERKLNAGLRNLHLEAQPAVAVRALTMGTVTGSSDADIALTHGEIVDRKSSRGIEPQVRAIYVRVWQRQGRDWRLLHDFTASVTP